MNLAHDAPNEPAGTYRAPVWLPTGHLQTIYPALALRRHFTYRRERWTTPDGDFIDLDWVDADATPCAPLVAVFHGLEGSSSSHYASGLAFALARARWRGVVIHFRGCSGTPNRLARAYHSGDTDEVAWVLGRLRAGQGKHPLFAFGVSLGGNALLKWLGERGADAAEAVHAACTASVPYDLAATGDHLACGANRIYTRHFLSTLKAKSLAKLVHFPGLLDTTAVRSARNLREFDDAVTAPLHGFRDTDDYWSRASSKPWLRSIVVPTLAINASNDPFVPSGALPGRDEVSTAVTLELTGEGGHCGFVTGKPPGRFEWLPARAIEFFRHQLSARRTTE